MLFLAAWANPGPGFDFSCIVYVLTGELAIFQELAEQGCRMTPGRGEWDMFQ